MKSLPVPVLVFASVSILPLRAAPIRVEFKAEVRTVVNQPFGLDVPRGTLVSGHFVYETDTPDSDALTGAFGRYEHAGTSEFEARFPRATIRGSGTAELLVRDNASGDTLEFVDGDNGLFSGGIMSRDGQADASLRARVHIFTGSGDTFTGDKPPDPFPFQFRKPLPFGHTFTVGDSSGLLNLAFTRLHTLRIYYLFQSISYASENHAVTLQWPTEPDRLYNIEFSRDLKAWCTIATGLAGVGGQGTFIDMLASRFAPDDIPGNGSYRVFEDP